MVECVSRKIQSKKMAKAFPFPQPTREKMQKREKNYAVFLSRGQISVAHSDLPWNNNVVLNGFVIYSNSCLFLFRNPHFISPSLPQMSQSNVQMLPIQTNAGQICYNATKWMWMRDTWIIKLPKLGHISVQTVCYCDTSWLLMFFMTKPYLRLASQWSRQVRWCQGLCRSGPSSAALSSAVEQYLILRCP